MAKYEDYLKRQEDADGIQTELDDAATNQETREQDTPENVFEMPDQFKNKSAEDIARSYMELQKLHGRTSNEVGELRKAVDSILNQGPSSPSEPEPEPEPVTIDRLYDDTEGTLRDVIQRETGSRIKSLEDELQTERLNKQLTQLDKDFPNWQEEARSEDFREWALARPWVKRTLQAADQYDMDAARELLGMWNEHKDANSKQRRSESISQATLESGGPEVPDRDVVFSRRELIDHRMRAMHGDEESLSFLAKNGEAIRAAYGEGRIKP